MTLLEALCLACAYASCFLSHPQMRPLPDAPDAYGFDRFFVADGARPYGLSWDGHARVACGREAAPMLYWS